MSQRILASLMVLAAALPLAAQSNSRADSMEAGVFRAVIQHHAGTKPGTILRAIEDAELCWGEFAATSCLTNAKHVAALASYRARNPKSATWSDAVLALVGVPVADALPGACDSGMHFAFSRAGFDAAYRVAIVRYTLTTGKGGGALCGTTDAATYVLQRGVDNTWSIATRLGGMTPP
jgi:hypothetical protein